MAYVQYIYCNSRLNRPERVVCSPIIGRAKRAPHCGCSIEILRDIYVGLSMGNHTKSTYVKKCVGEITWPKHAHA